MIFKMFLYKCEIQRAYKIYKKELTMGSLTVQKIGTQPGCETAGSLAVNQTETAGSLAFTSTSGSETAGSVASSGSTFNAIA